MRQLLAFIYVPDITGKENGIFSLDISVPSSHVKHININIKNHITIRYYFQTSEEKEREKS